MYVYKKLIIIFLLTLLSGKIDGQVVIWSETFETYANGSTISTDNNINDIGNDWSLTNGAVSGSFGVQSSNAIFGNMSFSANRADADIVNGSIWTSEVIDVSAYGTIDIGITFEEKGNLEITDWIDIEYNKNGTGWTNMTGGQRNGNFGGPISITEVLAGCTTIQIRVKAHTDANGEQIIFDNVYVSSPTPLPVELIYFTADLVKDEVVLEWATASEINNERFEVYRSKDGQEWELISTILGAGNSNCLIGYGIIDMNPYTGQSYYRIKQIDFDGQFEYSDIVTINYKTEKSIVVVPNPNNGEFYVELKGFEDKTVVLIVVNSAGVELYSKVRLIQSSKIIIGFDLKGRLPKGIYYITGSSDNEIFNKKIIIL